MATSKKKITLTRFSSKNEPSCTFDLTPAEYIGLMWQLTIDAWTFKGNFDAQSRLQRHVTQFKSTKS